MIKVEHISYEYHIKNSSDHLSPVLDDISFEVGEGELVSLIGPSGCGKTTLVNILAGYIPLGKGGSVFLNGRESHTPEKNKIVINQENDLFGWMTVLENMSFGLENKDKKKIDEYLDLVELADYKNHYPHELSGGMKKRISLARALAMEPAFIIMDEPFASLDYQTRETMHEKLINIQQRTKKSILLVTHDIEEALFLSHRVIILSSRPAKIKKMVDITFPYPRDHKIKNSPKFIKIKEEIRELLK